MTWRLVILAVVVLSLTLSLQTQEIIPGRKTLVLDGKSARLRVDLAGGAIAEFRFKSDELNPLSWAVPARGDLSPQPFGHFLCLDRWGPPSEAEGARGMPYHGEASHIEWSVEQNPVESNGLIEAQIKGTLPKAGLSVIRTIRMSAQEAVFSIREEVRNENALGRIFNMVQHPTIAPPFLDETTIVNCNGRKGFAQGGRLPNPEQPSSEWPNALKKDGQTVDLRRLTSDPNPNVVSFIIDQPEGWVTAANPGKALLIGYIWRKSDYPWVSLWRDVHDGKPAARGLEFGTTGLHQPFPILVQKGWIWERALFEYIDAGQTITKSYTSFLLKIPSDFAGTESIELTNGGLTLTERGKPGKQRTFSVKTGDL